jgi:translocation and assembly module TamA
MRLAAAPLHAALIAALGLAAATPTVWADSPVTIEGGEEDVREAILDLLPDRDEPESLFEAERIAEEAAARARAWLRSEGYYAATVTPEASEAPIRARLLIAPGARFRFEAPSIVFTDTSPSDDARALANGAMNGLVADAPARAASVLDAEANVLAVLRQAGYVDAEAAERRVVVDHETQRVAAALRFSIGERARLGALRAEPERVLRPSFVNDLSNWDYGEAYSPQALSRLRRDIIATGAVSRATTRLEPANTDGVRDVVLEIEQARRNSYEAGVGYSTTDGIILEAEWTRRNVTRRADSFTLATTLGEVQQEVRAELLRPHAAGLGHAIAYGVSAEREAPEGYTRAGIALYASVDAAQRLRESRSYGIRLSADRFDDLAGGVSDALVLSGFANWRRDTTEFSLDPRDGAITELRIEPSVSTGDATLAFVRATAEARGYESFSDDDAITFAARARIGWLEPLSGDANDAPPDRRFYAGGGGSVRGYDYNSIYPSERDTLGLSPGGQGLLETSAEVGWRLNDRWGAAAFVDGGTAFDDWSDAGDLSWGAGIGVRYDLGFAPLRIDIAAPLDDDEADNEYALYISVGQAF